MTRKFCIQSGHWNTTNGQTGAPRELERTLAIGKRLVDLIRASGHIAYHTDSQADKNKDVTGQDWNLFLSLHCDMDYPGTEGGGFIDFPEPSTDYATAESQRISKAIASVYFSESGIRNVPSRSNKNTRYYYMWSALSAKTACNILEMGESIDPHDKVILDDTERQAQIIFRGILNAFPDMNPDPCKVQVENLKGELKAANALLKTEQSANETKREEIRILKEEIETLRTDVQEAQNILNTKLAEKDRASQLELKAFQDEIIKLVEKYKHG